MREKLTLFAKPCSFKTLLSLLVLVMASGLASAQKKPSDFDKERIVDQARAQLTTMASADTGELWKFCAKNVIQGQFVFDLTLEGKGQVLTVFMVSSSADDVRQRNLLKDKLHQLAFADIKIPKKEKVKFRHTLNF